MPSTTPKQAKFMQAAAHNATFAKEAGIPQSVAKEFNAADQAKGKAKAVDNRGTHVRYKKPYVSGSRIKRG